MSRELDTVPEDFARAMAVVAHPDDLEYGAASAVARWTRAGRSVAYVIVTDGEAGIDGIPPAEAGPLRQEEQVASAAVVGVDDVAFLGHPDGVVENGLDLRRAIARQIRRFRPDVLVTATFDLTYRMAGQRVLNHADHRAVGVAALNAARDAGNRWTFPERLSATTTEEFVDGWEPARDAFNVFLADGLPLRTPASALAVQLRLDAATLDRKVVALRAQASQIAGLIAAVGEERASRWWAEESFVSADAVADTARTRGTWRVAA